jgi:hypothetical protein
VARAEAGEAATALEGAQRLGLVREAQAEPVLGLLWRLCAMLTRLGALGRRAFLEREQSDPRRRIAQKRRRVGWDNDYLFQVPAAVQGSA